MRQSSVNKQTRPPSQRRSVPVRVMQGEAGSGAGLHTQGRERPEPPARLWGPGKQRSALVWLQEENAFLFPGEMDSTADTSSRASGYLAVAFLTLCPSVRHVYIKVGNT